ncbi:hypothetical protein VNO77_33838 [Canavalia gladiata]|uniref:Uncharacterized protein n=1 Tax=Canavalia gladiata TaxID=3824 RepID=A0AAN9KFG4_CANGL
MQVRSLILIAGRTRVIESHSFGEARPSGKERLLGILVLKLNSRTIQQDVGVVDYLVMPHNVSLHSALVQSSIGLVNAGQYLQETCGGGLFPILYMGYWVISGSQSSTRIGAYAGCQPQIPFSLIPILYLVSKEQTMGSFRIDIVLEPISWLVATLVIVINGYRLLKFFNVEVNGVILGIVVGAITTAYVAFVINLVWRAITFLP